MSGLSKKEKDQLRALGIDPDLIQPVDAENTPAAKEMNSLAAEATLLSLTVISTERLRKNCKGCNRSFLTDYYSVAYCGDKCRVLALDEFGINWHNKSARERWGKDGYYQPPGIIPADALEAMARVLKLAGYGIETPIIETVSEPTTQREDQLIPNEPECSPAMVSLEYLKLDDRTLSEHSTTQKLNDIPQEKPSALLEELDDLWL